jgi:hypothetical protein
MVAGLFQLQLQLPLPVAARQDQLCQNTGRFSQNSLPISEPPREYLLSLLCKGDCAGITPALLILPRCSAASGATSTSDVAHGKRRIVPVVAGNYEASPHKRAKEEASGGILEAAQSTARTRRSPETRVPTITNNNTSKEAGCGVERLATPNAQGVYHHPLLGPSSQQGWALTNAQGQQLPWVEKRVEEEASHHIASAAQQEESHIFQIPSDFHEKYRILLAATEVDRTRGAVGEIKCRLCPNSEFTKWDDFKRHCKTTEAHPLEISFCDHCGDFFARSDSLKRHRNRPPCECLNVTPERAEEKRRETAREHGEFLRRVGRSLTTGEEIETPFAQIIKRKYPESSKKRTGNGW